MADLNGDSYDDLVLGMYYNGARKNLNACIYYGSPEGLVEEWRQLLPAPACTAVAPGDYDGDGRPDLAFLCAGKVRIFYQTIPAFEPKHFVDLEIAGEDLAAHHLYSDGRDEILLCQHHDAESYTTHSLVYRVMPDRSISQAARPVTHGARRVLVSRVAPYRKLQIIFVNAASRTRLGDLLVTVHLGGPDGFSPERRWTPHGWGAVDALYCDLNDDGYADLIVANAVENSVWLDPGSYV